MTKLINKSTAIRTKKSEVFSTGADGHLCFENMPINGFEQMFTILANEAF